MSSIFTKIVNGEIPAYKIAEDDRYLAFLDVNPNAKGHTLCIRNKKSIRFRHGRRPLFGLNAVCPKSGQSPRKNGTCKRIGVAVVGLEVPHVHVHLIPLHDMDDMRFQRKVALTKEEFESLAQQIQENL